MHEQLGFCLGAGAHLMLIWRPSLCAMSATDQVWYLRGLVLARWIWTAQVLCYAFHSKQMPCCAAILTTSNCGLSGAGRVALPEQ